MSRGFCSLAAASPGEAEVSQTSSSDRLIIHGANVIAPFVQSERLNSSTMRQMPQLSRLDAIVISSFQFLLSIASHLAWGFIMGLTSE